MPSLEERMQALEQKHAELEKTIELQTIAIGALVNKAALERLNERYDKLFETLINHDEFTNRQLAELRGQLIELDGKIVGQQTETRQRFDTVNNRFERIENALSEILTRLPEKPQQ
jgi:uncharacterized coiled-coil protein SlyX